MMKIEYDVGEIVLVRTVYNFFTLSQYVLWFKQNSKSIKSIGEFLHTQKKLCVRLSYIILCNLRHCLK